MGNKTYFEFLEEEFQVLTNELQKSLAQISSTTAAAQCRSSDFQKSSNNNDNDNINSNNDNEVMMAVQVATIGRQLTRCRAVYQQLRTECQGDIEFKDRLSLYKIQLEALRIEQERYM
mmetsp:Transcript_15729/g.17365  ORF Transcript_15729/g.17365 Transcript_15729/m.17365 type:complete len:118 (-) Transcript_15729:72-425(-)